MRARTLILFLVAILLAGGTAMLVRSWMAQQRPVEAITESKVVAPGSRGFLAAVLSPGMRAVSVPVSNTSGISGFVVPGDQVDILITHSLADNSSGKADAKHHTAAETVLHDVRVI